MTKYPRARNDDMFLYCKIAEVRGCSGEPLSEVLLNLKNYDMPPFETVRRSRQKVQEMRPDLKADIEVKDQRSRLQEEYENYART